MKLTQVELSGYRCFVKARLTVAPQATVLMGPNDTGKSYLLLALKAFSDRTDFKDDDQCAVLFDSNEALPQVSLEFSDFESDEIDMLVKLGLEFDNSDKLRITRTGLKAAQVEAFKNDYPLQIPAPSPPQQEQVAEPADTDGNQPGEDVSATPAKQKLAEESTSEIQEWVPAMSGWIIGNLLPIMPRIELLEDPDLLPAEIDLAQLTGEGPQFDTPKRLLWLGGIRDINSFQKADTRRRHQRLEDASRRLTRWIGEHWSQDKQVALKLVSDGSKLKFYILIQGNERLTDPTWHSPAFNWYLSLLTHLLYRREKERSIPILLMDEPGIHLHPRAQRDLVQVIRLLSEQTQIIYTAHYPYLIDRNFPGQIRLLQAGREGTTIENKPYHTQGDSVAWEPIRTGLGLTVGDSLLFDDYNVIVEGVVDQLLLCAVSQELSKIGDDRALDLNYTAVLPAGGASQEVDLAKRALANELNVVALFDGEAACKEEINSFKKELPDAPEPLSLGDYYKPGYDFSIEDMLPTPLYLDAVNRSYQTWYKAYTPIELKQLQGRKESIVEVLQELLPLAIAGGLEEARPHEQDSDQETQNAKEPKSNRAEILGSSEEAFHLSKVEVAKEAIHLLRDGGIRNKKGQLRREYERFATLFEAMKQRLEA